MMKVKCILGTVVLLMLSVWTEAGVVQDSTDPQHEMTVSERLELANKDLGGDILTGDGDSGVFRRVRRNADRCVKTHCKWPRSTDGTVYIPYVIDDSFTWNSKCVIRKTMRTFSQSTCIYFKARTCEGNYLHIRKSPQGCLSHVGRRGGEQVIHLKEPDCISIGVIQHELLHALGFRHEFTRSDRDSHIQVLWKNIDKKHWGNFVMVNTLNQGTPYDYNSVMHYGRFAGSKNKLPTLRAVPYPVPFGEATEMSQNDIDRVNLLYCPQPSRFNSRNPFWWYGGASQNEGSGFYPFS